MTDGCVKDSACYNKILPQLRMVDVVRCLVPMAILLLSAIGEVLKFLRPKPLPMFRSGATASNTTVQRIIDGSGDTLFKLADELVVQDTVVKMLDDLISDGLSVARKLSDIECLYILFFSSL